MSIGGSRLVNGKQQVDCGFVANDPDRGRAQQSMKDECDINKLIAKYADEDMVVHVNTRTPQYLDVSDVGDYQTAVNRVTRVAEFFQGLTAKVRNRFQNDPAEFLDFMSNPDNRDEAVELGLVPKPSVEPPPAAVTPPA